MGVHGLWKLLESSGRPINPESLEGKILAVVVQTSVYVKLVTLTSSQDISIWLNQAVKGVRDRDGSRVENAHLLTLFHRVCKLLYFRVRPVFVFDGDAPLLKKQTLAVRRRRREELTRESKQTNEKLLKTFLKRKAIQEALGEHSEEPVPSLSSVRRDEDDIYILPALPASEEKEISSGEEQEDERSADQMTESHHMYQGELYGDPNSVDINSEEFSSLPLEMKHQILKDMKEFSKRCRTMYHTPPECSSGFSQYQLEGLLHRKHLNCRLEEVEKEMNQSAAGAGPQLYGHTHQDHTIESRRLLSEDSTHYILIKGAQKPVKAPESQSAALPWAGGPLSGTRRPRADRPQPLWSTVCEEEEEEEKAQASSSSSAPTPNLLPPSPRTLQAIQLSSSSGADSQLGVANVPANQNSCGRILPVGLKPGEKLPEYSEMTQEEQNDEVKEGDVVLRQKEDEGVVDSAQSEGSDSEDGYIQVSDGDGPKEEEADDDVIETGEPSPSSSAHPGVQNDEDLKEDLTEDLKEDLKEDLIEDLKEDLIEDLKEDLTDDPKD
ncbi:hypothetical protein NHX12_005446 [Muraenolepis orangiensis]|uniref:XPG N-terminal domain-containing protein n=1 Tax=Muraenolepis orangiensis TaxID=630683 RepID=A0A9Q0IC13_9TELE|nr:hypothetical protein NHX12_005446 [Muraenolepis orangiensis]